MRDGAAIDAAALTLIAAVDIRGSRVFAETPAANDGVPASSHSTRAVLAPPG
jgi:hypothetical protein